MFYYVWRIVVLWYVSSRTFTCISNDPLLTWVPFNPNAPKNRILKGKDGGGVDQLTRSVGCCAHGNYFSHWMVILFQRAVWTVYIDYALYLFHQYIFFYPSLYTLFRTVWKHVKLKGWPIRCVMVHWEINRRTLLCVSFIVSLITHSFKLIRQANVLWWYTSSSMHHSGSRYPVL